MLMLRSVLMCLLVGLASGLRIATGAGAGAALGRRAAVARFAALGAVGAAAPALADTCVGKCADPLAAEKAAKRLEMATGRGATPPPTIAEMVQKSIDQQENVLGMSLSDAEKAKLEEKVRASYPGIK